MHETHGLNSPLRMAVIGGGISGLAAAHRLKELDPKAEVTVFEASDRLGGVLRTEEAEGFLIDHGPDQFITDVPWAIDLCRRLGLGDELLRTNQAKRRAFVVQRGKLHPVPEGFMLMSPRKLGPILRTRLLSPRGKLRLLREYFVPRRSDGADESLADFARRRLGRQAYERLVQPLVGGIYVADAEQLSIQATLPRFVKMEQEHGGLIRAALAERKRKAKPVASAPGSSSSSSSSFAESAARYGMFVTLRGGMAQLVNALVGRTECHSVPVNYHTACEVESISREKGGWRIATSSGNPSRPSRAQGVPPLFDQVILAVPAFVAARLLGSVDCGLADELARIPYAGSVVACVGYRREQIGHPLDGFGFVVPAVEQRRILAGSFSSVKFPGRAPDGCELIRVFLGGALQPELVEADDAELRGIVQRELGELLGVRDEPILWRVTRWRRAMPQYVLGHLDRVARIERLAEQLPGLHLAGNAYRGVGVPNCIHSGEEAAEACIAPMRTENSSQA